MKNKFYKTDNIVNFYKTHRRSWDELYSSEKWIFEHVAKDNNGSFGSILDVGCAVGGLGLSLSEKYEIESYTGIDINEQAILQAQKEKHKFPMECSFEYGDIIDYSEEGENQFDIVTSLSCADWNVDTSSIVESCWKKVKSGGYFIISLRLTPKEGVNDIKKSYQKIVFDNNKESGDEETANYVVFNIDDAITMFNSFIPHIWELTSYGYWGEPSSTAVTLYEKLVFAVFAAKKAVDGTIATKYELHLPSSLIKKEDWS